VLLEIARFFANGTRLGSEGERRNVEVEASFLGLFGVAAQAPIERGRHRQIRDFEGRKRSKLWLGFRGGAAERAKHWLVMEVEVKGIGGTRELWMRWILVFKRHCWLSEKEES
jgi:hypothetical protein